TTLKWETCDSPLSPTRWRRVAWRRTMARVRRCGDTSPRAHRARDRRGLGGAGRARATADGDDQPAVVRAGRPDGAVRAAERRSGRAVAGGRGGGRRGRSARAAGRGGG